MFCEVGWCRRQQRCVQFLRSSPWIGSYEVSHWVINDGVIGGGLGSTILASYGNSPNTNDFNYSIGSWYIDSLDGRVNVTDIDDSYGCIFSPEFNYGIHNAFYIVASGDSEYHNMYMNSYGMTSV